MADFNLDTATDTVTIDGVDFSVPAETDRAKILMISKLIDSIDALRRNLRNG